MSENQDGPGAVRGEIAIAAAYHVTVAGGDEKLYVT